MNKLFTKVAKLVVGLSLAAGVGVAIGSKAAERVDAETSDYTTTLTASSGAAAWTSSGATHLNVTLSNDGGANNPIFSNSTDIRLYNKNYITVSAKTAFSSSLTISDVTVNGKGSHNTNTQTLNYKSDGTLVKSGASTLSFPQKTAKSYDISFDDVASFNLYQSGNNNVQITSLVISYSITTSGGETPTTYTVTYDKNDSGASGTMSDSNSPYLASSTVTVLANSFTAPSGKVFEKWNTSSDGNGTDYLPDETFTINANTTLYAQWIDEPLNNEIVFDNIASDSSSAVTSDTALGFITSGKGYVSSFTDIDRAYKGTNGLKFGASSNTGSITFNFNTAKTASLNGLTLYAQIQDYGTDGGNFTFTSSQLSGSPVSVAKPSSLTKTAIAAFTSTPTTLTISTSAKRGYLKSLSFETPSGYTVSFNAGDGSGSMSSILDVSGSYTLPNCAFTAPEGYEFAGWKANNAGEIISAGGTYNVSANVTFYAQWSEIVVETYNFRKITKIAELNTSQVGGGRYVISNSANNAMVMSTTQNTNNRANTTATVENDEIVVTTPTTVAILNIEKTGDYYTIFDSANEGYLYGVSGSNHLKTSNPQTKTDYYYWSISFSGGHAVFTNKGSSYVIRVNTGNNPPIFSTYNGTQTAVDLYELDSDIPVSVALSSITASNSSVQVGSTITYSGTYSPANATEGIVIATLDTTYATAGDVSMSAGTFTVSITGVAATAGTSLEFEGEEGHGSASVTLVVVAYTATHDLVTGASSLSNGSRIVIACTDAEFNYIAEHSTGASNLNGVTTGFADDKSTLAATASQEFVIWCVDSVNGYYVFSDGDYFLASPTSKNNYLERTDVLSERCYFTITDDANGVSISNSYGVNHSWKDVSSAYTIYFNNTTSKFSLYANAQKSTSLYVSKQSVDSVQGFIDVFMHMNAYAANNGYCSDNDHHYYTDAKAAFTNQLNASQREAFCTQSAYASAYARLSSWADNNGDKIDTSYSLVQKSNAKLLGFGSYNENTNTIAIIVIISLVSVTAIGGYFFIKRREQN